MVAIRLYDGERFVSFFVSLLMRLRRLRKALEIGGFDKIFMKSLAMKVIGRGSTIILYVRT